MQTHEYKAACLAALNHPRFPVMEARLLAIGGESVFAQPDPHLDDVLERGRVFKPAGRKRVRGDLHCCHQNAALLYARHHSLGHGGACEIATGYALYEGGIWAQHSWLWDGARVIETNTSLRLYFGVVLEPLEAAMFVFSQVISRLPGAADLCR
jgi:hypothetical protein